MAHKDNEVRHPSDLSPIKDVFTETRQRVNPVGIEKFREQMQDGFFAGITSAYPSLFQTTAGHRADADKIARFVDTVQQDKLDILVPKDDNPNFQKFITFVHLYVTVPNRGKITYSQVAANRKALCTTFEITPNDLSSLLNFIPLNTRQALNVVTGMEQQLTHLS